MKIISIITGIIMIVIGVLNIMDLLVELNFSIAGITVTVPFDESLASIIIVNWLGGACLIYHSYKTLNFDKNLLKLYRANNSITELKTLSMDEWISGVIIILISFYLFIKFLAQMSGFDNNIVEYLPVILFIVCMYSFQILLPLMIVFKNIALNSSIERLSEKRWYKIESIKRKKAKQKT